MAQVQQSGEVLKQSTQFTRLFFYIQTGQTLTVNLSKSGGAFAGAAGAITEIANGWYKIVLTSVDTNTAGDLAYHITGGANTLDFQDYVAAQLFTDLSITAAGLANVSSSIKQNAALAGFTFVMTDSTTHIPVAGLTVTAQRSLGGAGFASCANAVSGVSNGVYTINLAAADLNSPTVMLRFTASGADDLNIGLITQP